jgi:uncharacterized protein YebE (UPF0316 family)
VELSSFTLPLLIFLAEVCVVTFGTLRIIFVARGQKILAPALGFFEVFIWLLAICQVMQNLSDWTCFIAFALGFMLGNYLGIIIEQKLALGTVIVRVITHRDAACLIEQLRAANFGVTCVEGKGTTGKVQIVMTIVKRKQLPEVVALIQTCHPGAFYAVDELQSACEGIFPAAKPKPGLVPLPFSKVFHSMMPHEQAELPAHGDDGADNRARQAAEPEPAAFR